MLANNLTLDDEEAVQTELAQLQAEAVCLPSAPRYCVVVADSLHS